MSIESAIRREQWLARLAWLSVLVPLGFFVLFAWQSVRLREDVGELRDEKERVQDERDGLAREKETLNGEIAELRKAKNELSQDLAVQKEIRQFANVRIQFYRESDRALVRDALSRQGFRIDSQLASSRLLRDRVPSMMAYGSNVHVGDLRSIAIALVRAGFGLKRIAPAEVQPDPNLIQIVASVRADQSCGLLTETQILQGLTCGPR